MRGRASTRRRTGGAILTVLLTQLAAPAILPSAESLAATSTSWSLALVQQPHPHRDDTMARLYLPADAEVRFGSGDGWLTVNASPFEESDRADLYFSAPPGQTLRSGTYRRTTDAGTPGRPALAVTYDGHGCSEPSEGRFDVRELHRDARGKIDRFWVVFEYRCGHAPQAMFGEIRVGIPDGGTEATIAPSSVWFPDAYAGATGTFVPVTVVGGPDGTTVADVRLGGAHAGDFALASDTCSGVTLAPSERCEIWVAPAPSAPGPRTAALVVTSSARTRIPLDVRSLGTTTTIDLDGDPGDWIADGVSTTYGSTNAVIDAWGDPRTVHGYVMGTDGKQYDWAFDAGAGASLTPGVTVPVDATAYPYNEDEPGMIVHGNSHTCTTTEGSFTVHEISFGGGGSLRSLALEFEQHCDDATAALRGEIRFQVPGPDVATPAPPGQLDLTRSQDGRRLHVSWVDPPEDLAYTIVRFLEGRTPIGPVSGWAGGAGLDGSAVLTRLDPARGVGVAVFAVDASGNVSRRAAARA